MAVTVPEELMEEILERLPAKSLMRFRSVKPSWNALFKTNSFVRRHSQRRRERGSDEHFMILYFDSLPAIDKTKITLLSSNEPPLLELPDVQFPFGHNSNVFLTPYGSCNGVFCLYYKDDSTSGIILWNPATREVKFLPPSQNPNVFCVYGFGADPNTFNEFKFIQLYNNNNDTVPQVSAELYNTGTNSWMVLHDINANDYIHCVTQLLWREYAFVNGVIHWLSSDRTYILCFDFSSNQFHKLKDLPSLSTRIFAASDSIACVARHSLLEGEIEFEISILKQDSGWTKICKFPLDCFQVIYGIWKDCTEFISGSEYEQLVSYNSDGQPMCQFEIRPDDDGNFFMFKYEQSIAPLSL